MIPLCRYHAVQEFNRGVFDYLIATDESGLEGHDRDTEEKEVVDVDAPTRSFFLACSRRANHS